MSGRAPLRAAAVLLTVLAACEPSGQAPEPRVYPRWWQELPTATPTATATPGPSVSPTPAATSESTATPTATATSVPTVSPTPEPPRCRVTVLDHEPVDPFDLVGIVEVVSRGPAANPESALEAARLQACSLGGDALILIYKRERRLSGQVGKPPPPGVLPDPELRGVVIRYRQR